MFNKTVTRVSVYTHLRWQIPLVSLLQTADGPRLSTKDDIIMALYLSTKDDIIMALYLSTKDDIIMALYLSTKVNIIMALYLSTNDDRCPLSVH